MNKKEIAKIIVKCSEMTTQFAYEKNKDKKISQEDLQDIISDTMAAFAAFISDGLGVNKEVNEEMGNPLPQTEGDA